jgi:hypothetical protein
MRRRRIISVLVLIVTCASLPAAAAPAAAPGAEEESPPLGFLLQGTHGYLIAASAYADPITGREGIGITVSRGNEAVSYSAPAKVTPDSIRADLGSLGRVDLVLHRSGHETSVDTRCLSHPERYEAGAYEGIVEFNGEGGFTRARATKVAGRPTDALVVRRFCDRLGSAESRGSNEPGARLAGISYAHDRTLKFQVNKNRPDGETLFSATLNERHDGIRIYRQLAGAAPARAFRYGRNLRTATLSPPAPFAGSATLTRSRNSLSPFFTGDLTAAFPGRSVRLAGHGVHVSLVHARLTKSSSSNSASLSFPD